jgi:hypothetical protein
MEILEKNTDGFINFQGMMVGNPYVDPFSNTITQIQAFYAHGLINRPLFDQWSTKCKQRATYDSEDCNALMIEMFKELYGKINPYALDYPICIEKKTRHHPIVGQESGIEVDGSIDTRALESQKTTSKQALKLLNASTAGGPPFLPTDDVYRPCSEEHLKTYLRRDDVRDALHVSPSAFKWKDCSDKINFNSEDFDASLIDLYKELIEAAKETGIEIFVFSGDDDSVCSTAGYVICGKFFWSSALFDSRILTRWSCFGLFFIYNSTCKGRNTGFGV